MHCKTVDVQHYRERLIATGHTQADLCRRARVHYVRLNGALNGLWGLTEPQAERVDAVLTEWERTATAPAEGSGQQ